jgi:hypothetical protein
MENLPAELVQMILEYLGPLDLLEVACVNYYFYLAGTAQLFSRLTFYVDPYTADLTPKSARLLVQIYSDRDIRGAAFRRREFVHAAAILPSPEPCFRVAPRAFRTLHTTFFQLIADRSIRRGLKQFRWRMGCPESVDRFPMLFPAHLRVLECAACQVDAAVLFPSLRTLALRRVRAADGTWVSRQIRQSKLEHLSISGFSDTELIQVSCFARPNETHLGWLKRFELEYVHLDAWPVPPTNQLQQLVLRSCVEDESAYAACAVSLCRLEVFTLVSAYDVWELASFRQMLSSFIQLKELTLLLARRTANVPLSEIVPLRPSLRVLVLESRLFSVVPANSYLYTLDEIRLLLAEVPNLQVLGVCVDLLEMEASNVCSSNRGL